MFLNRLKLTIKNTIAISPICLCFAVCEAQGSAVNHFIYSLTLFLLLELLFKLLLSLWQMATTRSRHSSAGVFCSSLLLISLTTLLVSFYGSFTGSLSQTLLHLTLPLSSDWQATWRRWRLGWGCRFLTWARNRPTCGRPESAPTRLVPLSSAQPCPSSSIKKPKVISVFKLCMWKT